MVGMKIMIHAQEKNTIHAPSVGGKREAGMIKNARDIFLVAMKIIMMMRIKLCAEYQKKD